MKIVNIVEFIEDFDFNKIPESGKSVNLNTATINKPEYKVVLNELLDIKVDELLIFDMSKEQFFVKYYTNHLKDGVLLNNHIAQELVRTFYCLAHSKRVVNSLTFESIKYEEFEGEINMNYKNSSWSVRFVKFDNFLILKPMTIAPNLFSQIER